jgi:hypothetical protein
VDVLGFAAGGMAGVVEGIGRMRIGVSIRSCERTPHKKGRTKVRHDEMIMNNFRGAWWAGVVCALHMDGAVES